MKRKTVFILIVLISLLLTSTGSVLAAPPDKFPVCHDTGDPEKPYVLLNLPETPYLIHLGHGDPVPGDPVPGVLGAYFLDDCTFSNPYTAFPDFIYFQDYQHLIHIIVPFGDAGTPAGGPAYTEVGQQLVFGFENLYLTMEDLLDGVFDPAFPLTLAVDGPGVSIPAHDAKIYYEEPYYVDQTGPAWMWDHDGDGVGDGDGDGIGDFSDGSAMIAFRYDFTPTTAGTYYFTFNYNGYEEIITVLVSNPYTAFPDFIYWQTYDHLIHLFVFPGEEGTPTGGPAYTAVGQQLVFGFEFFDVTIEDLIAGMGGEPGVNITVAVEGPGVSIPEHSANAYFEEPFYMDTTGPAWMWDHDGDGVGDGDSDGIGDFPAGNAFIFFRYHFTPTTPGTYYFTFNYVGFVIETITVEVSP